METVIKELERILKRNEVSLNLYEDYSKCHEKDLPYHTGFNLGYLKGRVFEVEDMIDILKELHQELPQQYNHWNSLSMHEPVGVKVLFKLVTGEQVLVFRKEPTLVKGRPNDYYKVLYGDNGEVVGEELFEFKESDVVGWTYP